METNHSNKSYFKTITGILVAISIIAIFVAFALGVMGSNKFSDKGVQSTNTGTPITLENIPENISEEILKTSPGCGDVPVAQKCELGPYNTEAGSLTLTGTNFPYCDTTQDLPLCITQDDANEWWFTVKSCGGYTPVDAGFWQSGISFYQDKDKDGDLDWVQGWQLEWDDGTYVGPCCTCYEYKATVVDCGNKVCLDSNRYPTIDSCLPCELIKPDDQEFIPGKEVYIKIKTLWEGCKLEEQQFAIILAHKNHIPGIHNSRINI